jgi:hypothetical protein
VDTIPVLMVTVPWWRWPPSTSRKLILISEVVPAVEVLATVIPAVEVLATIIPAVEVLAATVVPAVEVLAAAIIPAVVVLAAAVAPAVVVLTTAVVPAVVVLATTIVSAVVVLTAIVSADVVLTTVIPPVVVLTTIVPADIVLATIIPAVVELPFIPAVVHLPFIPAVEVVAASVAGIVHIATSSPSEVITMVCSPARLETATYTIAQGLSPMTTLHKSNNSNKVFKNAQYNKWEIVLFQYSIETIPTSTKLQKKTRSADIQKPKSILSCLLNKHAGH